MPYPGHSAYSPPAASKVANGPPPGGSPGISETTIMSDQNNASTPAETSTVADAITGRKASKQYHLAFGAPLLKIAVQTVKASFAFKNDSEAVEILLGALLGTLPKIGKEETEDAAGDRIGEALANLPAVIAMGEAVEKDRKRRKIEAQQRAAALMAENAAAALAALDAAKEDA